MQKILNLQSDNRIYQDELIISSSNLEAYNTIIKSNTWQNNRVLLIGPKKSGKTLLANLWKKKTGAMLLHNINDLSTNNKIIVDNLEYFRDEDLISIINFAQEKSTLLLVISSSYPIFKLKDLNSRIISTYKVIIKQPDEKLAKLLISSFFKSKQILISNDIINFIYVNIEREYSAINKILNILNEQAMIKKRKITLQFIKEIFTTSYMPYEL